MEGGDIGLWAPQYASNYAIGPYFGYFDPTMVNYEIADVHNNASNVSFWDGHLQSFRAVASTTGSPTTTIRDVVSCAIQRR